MSYITNFSKVTARNTSTVNTRRVPSKALMDFIKEWTSETDFDDYMEMQIDKYVPLHYKIMNELLILLQTNTDDNKLSNCEAFIELYNAEKINIEDDNHDPYKDTLFIDFLKECFKNKKKIINCILPQIINIIKLQHNLSMTPTIDKVDLREDISKKSLILYRGFNFFSYKFLNLIGNYGINDTITTQMFLSTSVLKEISLQFLSNKPDINDNIMWEIIVPPNKLSIFNYNYFGQDLNISTDNIINIIDTNNFESEILLNLGAILKCINIKTVYNYNFSYGPINIVNKSFRLYTFEFMGWNKKYIDELIDNLKKFEICLANINKDGTKKTVDKTRSIIKKTKK